jgi:hypothetical protein
LYRLFGELNQAGVQWTGIQAVQLGGPIAAFFAVLILLWKMYKEFYKFDNYLESKLSGLVGEWTLESESHGKNRRKAISQTKIEFLNGELCINGGTFFNVAPDGSRGAPIGDWIVDMAVSDGNRLKYFYTLTDNLADHSTWKGISELAMQENSDTMTFQGTWQVLSSKETHNGQVTLKKLGKHQSKPKP